MEFRELNLTDKKNTERMVMLVREIVTEFPELEAQYEDITILLVSKEQFQDGTLDRALKTIFGFAISTSTGGSVVACGIGVGRKGCLQFVLEPFENQSERMQRFVIRHECCHLLFPQIRSESQQLLLKNYPSDFLSQLEFLRNEYPVNTCMMERYAEDWLQKPPEFSEEIISPRIAYRQAAKREGVGQANFCAIINSIHVLQVIYIYEFLLSRKPELKEKCAGDIRRYYGYLNSWWHCLERSSESQLPKPDKIFRPYHFASKEKFFHQISSLLALCP